MSEMTLFESAEVLVTNRRVVAGGVTYPVSAITSVRVEVSSRPHLTAWVWMVAGILTTPVLIGLLAIRHALRLGLHREDYRVVLSAAGVGGDAVQATSRAEVLSIHDAISRAVAGGMEAGKQN